MTIRGVVATIHAPRHISTKCIPGVQFYTLCQDMMLIEFDIDIPYNDFYYVATRDDMNRMSAYSAVVYVYMASASEWLGTVIVRRNHLR